MDVQCGLFCRGVTKGDGKFSIDEVIDGVSWDKLPVGFGRSAFVFRVFLGPGEEVSHKLELRLIEPSGKVRILISQDRDAQVLVDGLLKLEVDWEIKDAVFPEYGVYWFEVYVDGELATRCPLHITPA